MKINSQIYWKLSAGLIITTLILYFKLVWLLLVLLLFAIAFAIYTFTAKNIAVPYFRKLFKTVSFILSIFLIAASIKTLVMDIFFVPSDSMEELLFPGDIILINKLTYGPKLPQSPFEIPWFNIPIYFYNQARSKVGEQWWPYYRLGGYGCVNKGDVIVYQFDDVFVTKRCVAVSGDSIAMINGKAFVNNKEYEEPQTVKNEYVIEVNDGHKFYQKTTTLGYCCIVRQDTVKNKFIGNFSYSTLAKIKKFAEVKSLHLLLSHYDLTNPIFANPINKMWSLDNMGPFIVPKKGMKILLTQESYNIYKKVLTEFEKINIEERNGELFVRNTKIGTYVFRQNYFFVLGDNRKNSEDSRIIGFIPETKIIGKIQCKL